MSNEQNQSWEKFRRATTMASFISLVTSNGPQIFLWAVGAMSFGFLAQITDFMEPFAPLGYLVAATVGLLSGQLGVLLFRVSRTMAATASFHEKLSRIPNRINPLDTTFEKKVISLSDFSRPGKQLYEGKTFTDCEFHGPGNMAMIEGHIDGMAIDPGDILVPRDGLTTCAIVFKNCYFINCSYFRIGIVVSQETAIDMLSRAANYTPPVS